MAEAVPAENRIDEGVRVQVYRWAYRFLRNHHDALDATQEVLLKWLRSGGEGIAHPQAWLRRMTTNHCIDVVRRRRRPSGIEAEPIDTDTPAAAADRQELRLRIAAALKRLSEQQRQVLVAKVYDRETFASIAESMGLSVSTVKTHYVRALRAMGEVLKRPNWE